MVCDRLQLRIPKLSELNYRKKILADSETMDYNIGYGEVDETGCIDFNENCWNDWFSRWVNNMPDQYYAYIIKGDENIPVGEVALRYVSERKSYCVNIIIEARHRGSGYSEQALKLLVDTAFNELGVEKIYDDFQSSRLSAEKIFKKIGFKRISDDIVELTKKDYLNLLNQNIQA
jgi:N-acetylglutamate synthase-like GNAT family acetyltransferase